MFLSLILSLTAITTIAQEINPNPEKEKNFPTFLLTPNLEPEGSAFQKALVQPLAPGHAACMSIPHYVQAKNGYEAGKVYKAAPCVKKGFGFEDLLLTFFIGAAVAVATDEIVFHNH